MQRRKAHTVGCDYLKVSILWWQDSSNGTEHGLAGVVTALSQNSSVHDVEKGGPSARPAETVKDAEALTGEFKELVTRMALEKFDFHQWFRSSSGVAIGPRAPASCTRNPAHDSVYLGLGADGIVDHLVESCT